MLWNMRNTAFYEEKCTFDKYIFAKHSFDLFCCLFVFVQVLPQMKNVSL